MSLFLRRWSFQFRRTTNLAHLKQPLHHQPLQEYPVATAILHIKSQRIRKRCLPASIPSLFDCTRTFSCNRNLFRPQTNASKPAAPHGPLVRFLYRFFAYTGFFILASGSLVVAFFVYDATTYNEGGGTADVQVPERALSPKIGGPKNLPIAGALVDDADNETLAAQKDKPKLVVLGTGWGSIALLKNLNPDDYHVTVVSGVNHFLFTPMLPSATVGTLEFRSLVEPARKIIQRVKGHFLQAQAEDVDFSDKLVEVSQLDSQGNKNSFYLPYDKLVIGVGKL